MNFRLLTLIVAASLAVLPGCAKKDKKERKPRTEHVKKEATKKATKEKAPKKTRKEKEPQQKELMSKPTIDIVEVDVTPEGRIVQ